MGAAPSILGLDNALPEALDPNPEEYTIVLVRHGESEWNLENRFTGWHDVSLTEKGTNEAITGGKLVAEGNFQFDMAFTSYLKRAIRTCWHVLEQSNQMHIPVVRAWQLNERHYGSLQGLNKQETVEKHGKEQVMLWRRSYDTPPPACEESNSHYPGNDPKYRHLTKDQLPKAESLKMTLARVLPYWETTIVPVVKTGRRILIAAHGNSLRALVMHLDNIPETEITELNIPTGVPLVYKLDKDLKPIPQADCIAPLSGRYLGDQEAIKAKILGVKQQTK